MMSRSVMGAATIGLLATGILLTASGLPHATAAPQRFLYTFNVNGTLFETGKIEDSSSPYFWVTSGAKLIIKDGIGKTIQGPLPASDARRQLYASMNPLDTDGGLYPQNTFRLVTKNVWQDADVSLHFNIAKTNLTDTPNRDGYSGIFLMGRYVDQYNLYYVGIRQDGDAVIKKKIGGTYYTLAESHVFGKKGAYNKSTNPNLLPQNQWVGMKAVFTNQSDGSVKVDLLVDQTNQNNWTSILTATDTGIGGKPLSAAGRAGVRTDFMDTLFDNFEVRTI